jgi:hypothetical protein
MKTNKAQLKLSGSAFEYLFTCIIIHVVKGDRCNLQQGCLFTFIGLRVLHYRRAAVIYTFPEIEIYGSCK